VNVSKELVLTAGTFNTAKLLLLSGIGDEKELNNFPDIAQVANVPGVGMHFQDHTIVSELEGKRKR
jgi:choline dehydrogenase